MKQYGEITIDETKLKVGDLMAVILECNSAESLFTFADKAIVGGIKDLPIGDFPKAMTAVMQYLHENQQVIAIAISSMSNFLKGDE